MKNLGYYNGKYDEIEKMQIPMLDRVCWFGDGVYDGCAPYKILQFRKTSRYEHSDRA